MGDRLILEISSRDNPRFKSLRKLADSSKRVNREMRALLEGVHLVEAALNADVFPREIVVTQAARGNEEIASVLQRMPDVPTIQFTDALFGDISDISVSVGLIAVIDTPRNSASDTVFDIDVIMLDGVQDAGNVGNILRTAVAVGIRKVVLGNGCAGAWTRKVLRAGQGAHFHLDIEEGLDLTQCLQIQSIPKLGLSVDTDIDLYQLDLRNPRLWIFGSEGQGISHEVSSRLNQLAKIPMMPGIESLNVATAAAVCLYEGLRQRRD